jgi:tRNA dimethylallyltransferase
MTSLRPVIAICGTTGVGKSKLAIQLALSLANAATVINADSMQVYAGLDIITNKVPESQMCGVPHQLIGFKKPAEQYTVGQWTDDASKAVCLSPLASSLHLI